ncbi:MAG: PAS domain S-box protein [Candidatus Moranbacteria bacterium]|nr:PAS domain S-box protein [Candidatus Moranbacteria bacterium]
MTDERNYKDELTKCEAIFNATLDGLLLLNMDGKIVDANEAALNILKYPKEDMLGKELTTFHTSEYKDRCEKNIQTALKGERSCCDCSFISAEGKLIFADNLLKKVAIGDTKFVLVSFHDISRQRETEERLEVELETLRKMNKLMTGREERIIELKNKINNSKNNLKSCRLE